MSGPPIVGAVRQAQWANMGRGFILVVPALAGVLVFGIVASGRTLDPVDRDEIAREVDLGCRQGNSLEAARHLAGMMQDARSGEAKASNDRIRAAVAKSCSKLFLQFTARSKPECITNFGGTLNDCL